MTKQKPTLNIDILRNSIITDLQLTYAEYKEKVIKNLKYTCINSDGEFMVLAGIEDRIKEIEELNSKINSLREDLKIVKEGNIDEIEKRFF